MKPAKIMQVRTLAVNRICYSNLEQLCIACRKYTLTEDDVSALTSGGRITHAYLSVYDC